MNQQRGTFPIKNGRQLNSLICQNLFYKIRKDEAKAIEAIISRTLCSSVIKIVLNINTSNNVCNKGLFQMLNF
jgi:hypothetical protein